jgi:pSer/pThr/pTyr-binding forkhead associated (FHA) protein
MLEDEIQYIGTRMAPAVVPTPARPFPSPQNPVTGKDRGHIILCSESLDERILLGVILHVEENGGQAARDMTFHRAQNSAVIIGRKSSSDHKFGRTDDGFGNAGFACQVVSGRHAKLAFSDSGYVSTVYLIFLSISPYLLLVLFQVYLIDLASRHGTHILHPGDTVSKMLDPEVATMLSNGDIITFGKTVGKGSYLVPPVTARVELLFGNQSDICAIISADTATRSPVVASEGGSRSRRSSTGRYGLYVPSSLSSPDASSDDDSSLKYDHDSDIEEITPPASSPDRAGHHSFASSLPVLPIIRGLQAHFYGEPHDDSFPFGSPIDNLRLPAIDRLPDRSRSHSPMDLSSPTPTPIGAWPSFVMPFSSPSDARESNPKHVSDEVRAVGAQEVVGVKSSGSMFSEAISPQSRGASENPGPDIGKPSSDQSSNDESRSPSLPSEFDLPGREKEVESEIGKEQEIHDRMMLLSATIGRIHVSALFL